MRAGGPEVQLGVAQPSTASDISEIERPNLKGVRASVFYSTCPRHHNSINAIVKHLLTVPTAATRDGV